jgi:hypothetical protein
MITDMSKERRIILTEVWDRWVNLSNEDFDTWLHTQMNHVSKNSPNCSNMVLCGAGIQKANEPLPSEGSAKTVSGSHYTAMCKYEGGDCKCTSVCLFE